MPSQALLTLPAPAKLNLFLHITGRRPDGYHELQTVFQLLDYGDELRFSRRADDQISLDCSEPGLAGPDNLVLRAAALLQPLARRPYGLHIHLHKRLPAGGGLGGGSSDAATTLLALNLLWDCGQDRSTLMQLGRGLGADVPVFVAGHSAWAEGIGERLQPLALPPRWYLVLTPACHASTARIFGHPELTRDSPAIKIPRFPFPGTRNDCEAVATRLHPEIREALDWLASHAEAGFAARMSGTGASVFASFANREAALSALAQRPAGMQAFVAAGCNESPLYRTPGNELLNYWGVAKR